MGGAQWLALFALIRGCWVARFLMSVPADLRAAGQVYGADFWVAFCTLTPDAAGLSKMIVMWLLMSGGMMAPTALPAFATYEGFTHADQSARIGPLVQGYLLIWAGFSGVAALLQLFLLQQGLLTPFGDSLSALLSAALLARRCERALAGASTGGGRSHEPPDGTCWFRPLPTAPLRTDSISAAPGRLRD